MNMHSPKAGALKDRQFVLATDLDGTFLGGSDEDRRRLYDWIEANRETVGLIFVTGRDPEFIGELCPPGVCPGRTMRWAMSARQSPRFRPDGRVADLHLEAGDRGALGRCRRHGSGRGSTAIRG
jgi:hypothetical protein